MTILLSVGSSNKQQNETEHTRHLSAIPNLQRGWMTKQCANSKARYSEFAAGLNRPLQARWILVKPPERLPLPTRRNTTNLRGRHLSRGSPIHRRSHLEAVTHLSWSQIVDGFVKLRKLGFGKRIRRRCERCHPGHQDLRLHRDKLLSLGAIVFALVQSAGDF